MQHQYSAQQLSSGPSEAQQDSKSSMSFNAVPSWGSFLYNNYLLPAFSPSEWLNNTPNPNNPQPTNDYFGQQPSSSAGATWGSNAGLGQTGTTIKSEPDAISQPLLRSVTHPMPASQQAGPSNYYPYYLPNSIPTSLLLSQQPSSHDISPSVDVIDSQIVRSPSPLSAQITPSHSPGRGVKRRASSMDSDGFDEHEAEAEGVERDGMIWGMKVEDYRALSARERKRVRNRISARTFRAKRKEHLSVLENDLESKDVQIKAARDESAKLRNEVAELKRRLAKYEAV